MVVGVLLSGGVALAGLGLTASTAGAAPANPGPTIDHSDFGIPVVECIQCQRTLPGDGSVRVACRRTHPPGWGGLLSPVPPPPPPHQTAKEPLCPPPLHLLGGGRTFT